MKEIKVTEKEAGQRLDKLLGKYLNLAGKGFIYKMLRKKNITLNGKKCDGSERVEAGDEIKLFLSDDTIAGFSRVSLQKVKKTRLDIIYEDPHILLINKPAGMLSQKAKEGDESLVEYVTDYLLDKGALTREDLRTFRPGVCNRLDRNTSGLVAAGKSLAGLQIMGKVFQDRSIHKYYYCIVKGTGHGAYAEDGKEGWSGKAWEENPGREPGPLGRGQTIEGFLRKDERTNQVSIHREQVPGSVYIATRYEPVACREGYILLRILLITGRSHQIRAHLSSIGYPIVGDVKYGNERVNEEAKKRFQIRHQMLHSYRMEFPELREPLDYLSGKAFEAPVPEEFVRVFGEELW